MQSTSCSAIGASAHCANCKVSDGYRKTCDLIGIQNMPKELSPLEAAKIANAVYSMNKIDQLHDKKEKRQFQTGLAGVGGSGGGFDATGRFEGSSGYDNVRTPTALTQNLLVRKGSKARSGFGFFARGEGKNSDQVIVATRGTDTMSDVLTDLWAMPSPSPMGSSCHSGFVDTFKSYQDDLKAFKDGIKKGSTIHCVGHSLGGALATLNADFFSQHGFHVKLYTFGSPKVGFGGALKRSLQTNNATIYRAFHDGDPVPMVPCWPFLHTGKDCCIGRQTLITPGAHSMDGSYIPASSGFASWTAFQRSPDPMAHKDLGVLEGAIEHAKVLGAGTLKVLMYAVKKLIRAAEVILGVAVIGTMALLDFLAWMFYKAAVLTASFSQALMKVLGGIMRFLGRQFDRGVKLTESFIHFLLQQLFNVISSRATLALLGSLAGSAVASLPATFPLDIIHHL